MSEMNYFKNKKILLTGGGGFVGKHVKKELINKGVLEKNIFVTRSKIMIFEIKNCRKK
jgi:nucleoside-diphosphate-sugar epimerase